MPTLDLSKAINQLLEEYGTDVDGAIKEALNKVGKEAVNVLKEKSPVGKSKKAGQYKKGWRAENVKIAYGSYRIITHNKTDWALTHLLNNGFYSVRAGRRIPGDGHIDAAEAVLNEMLIKTVEESL